MLMMRMLLRIRILLHLHHYLLLHLLHHHYLLHLLGRGDAARLDAHALELRGLLLHRRQERTGRRRGRGGRRWR